MTAKLKVLDLFSGIGGFSLGLESAGGYETVAFCEMDLKAVKVLNKHWPSVPVYSDVKDITIERLTEDGTVPDVITGGFPCQDISVAGRGAGLEGSRSGLWWEFHRIIKEVRPGWAIIENVAALRSRGLDQVLRGLAEIGYDAEWHCIPASAVGAPHQRDRIWIMAYPSSERLQERRQPGWAEGKAKAGARLVTEPERCREEVANPNSQGLALGERVRIDLGEALFRWSSSPRPAAQLCPISGGTIYPWAVEPQLGRVADGIPHRVDRLKQLGNSVVHQIPMIIGQAILSSK